MRMKKILTFGITAVFASAALAQVPMGAPDGTGIIYSLNPLPPIVSNNQINYPPGAPYVDATGVNRACKTPLVIDHANGNPHAICADRAATPANDAANLANLAPAAGGPQSLSDRNLSSDGKLGLRTDRATIGPQ